MASRLALSTYTGRSPLRFQPGQTKVAVPPPLSLQELEQRAERLPGSTLSEIAALLGAVVPQDLRRHKGWVGQLVEAFLGANAGSRAEPDFPHLGVELKTLPIDSSGRPLESTFVCSVELDQIDHSEWDGSRLFAKLGRVLWVPVEGTRSIALGARRIGAPFLWEPNEEEEALLRRDWELLTLMIAQGRVGEITAHLGHVLQIRPKARRGSSARLANDEDGALYWEQPKGFYLRASFTKVIVARRLWAR